MPCWVLMDLSDKDSTHHTIGKKAQVANGAQGVLFKLRVQILWRTFISFSRFVLPVMQQPAW